MNYTINPILSQPFQPDDLTCVKLVFFKKLLILSGLSFISWYCVVAEA